MAFVRDAIHSTVSVLIRAEGSAALRVPEEPEYTVLLEASTTAKATPGTLDGDRVERRLSIEDLAADEIFIVVIICFVRSST